MFEYDARKREIFASPTNNIAGKMFTISPDLNYDNHRLMSEGRSSSEKNEIDYIERFNKSRSALSGIKGKRYFSMPRTHKNSKHSISSSRTGIPSYFKDAAELLLSRIEKQYRKYFNMLKTHCDEVRFKPLKAKDKYDVPKQSNNVNDRYRSSMNSDDAELQFNRFSKISEMETIQNAQINLEAKERIVTPTEFLLNNDEFGKLKESNDTIFSFGTNSQGRIDFLGDMTHSSHNSKTSSIERKINKEFCIDEIKEVDVEHTEKEDSEHDEKIIKVIDNPHFIGDGTNDNSIDNLNSFKQFLPTSPPPLSQQILEDELDQRVAQSEGKFRYFK